MSVCKHSEPPLKALCQRYHCIDYQMLPNPAGTSLLAIMEIPCLSQREGQCKIAVMSQGFETKPTCVWIPLLPPASCMTRSPFLVSGLELTALPVLRGHCEKHLRSLEVHRYIVSTQKWKLA